MVRILSQFPSSSYYVFVQGDETGLIITFHIAFAHKRFMVLMGSVGVWHFDQMLLNGGAAA